MIKRTYPKPKRKTLEQKPSEWFELDHWGLIKEVSTRALIYNEPEGSRKKGFFEIVDLVFKVKEEASGFYLKVEGRREIVDYRTKHVREYASVWVRNIRTGQTWQAVHNERDRRQSMTFPYVFFVDVERSEPKRISNKEAQNLVETKQSVIGVYGDPELERRVK